MNQQIFSIIDEFVRPLQHHILQKGGLSLKVGSQARHEIVGQPIHVRAHSQTFYCRLLKNGPGADALDILRL